MKSVYPTTSINTIRKLITSAWKKMSKEEKEKYNKLSALDRERYKKELAAAFVADNQDDT